MIINQATGLSTRARDGLPTSSGRAACRPASLILGTLLFGTTLLVAGCSATTQNKVLQYTPDPVAEARSVIQGYANGQPIGSEMGTYDDLVSRVTAANADKGAKLKQYLSEIKKTGRADAAKAKKMLADF